MSFGIFILYFIGAVATLFIGWLILQLVIILIVRVTMTTADGSKKWCESRAARKWERIESELGEDK